MQSALAPPSPLADRYVIERELGRGGMAIVWLARDARENRPVAIKVLNRELAGVVGVGRFLREIQVTAGLDHPSVVPVLDTGTWNADGVAQPWYAMPFMEGGSLRARLTSDRQLAIDDALRIALDLADALQTAHAKGVVHRDIKPENILFSEGRPRLVDFGIAKALHYSAFSEAVRRDSNYAPAWVGLAKTYVWACMRSFPLPAVARDSIPMLAAAAAENAIGLDSTNAEAWLARGHVSRLIDPTNYDPVLRFVRRSIALDSSSAETWHFLASYEMDRGNTDTAITAWRRAVRVGPTYLQGLSFLALAHYWRRQYDSATKWADSAVALDGNYLFGRQTAGRIAVERGKYEQAESAFEAARRLSTGVELAHADAFKALTLARAGDNRAAREIIRRAETRPSRSSPRRVTRPCTWRTPIRRGESKGHRLAATLRSQTRSAFPDAPSLRPAFRPARR